MLCQACTVSASFDEVHLCMQDSKLQTRHRKLTRDMGLDELKNADGVSDYTFDQDHSSQGSPSKRRKREGFLSSNSVPFGVI